MPGRRRAPLFLKPQSYRQRRMRDAARLLPVFGAFFFLLPVLWQPGQTARPDTAPDGLFLFAVWGGLILVAAVLAPGLTAEPVEEGTADDGPVTMADGAADVRTGATGAVWATAEVPGGDRTPERTPDRTPDGAPDRTPEREPGEG